MNKSKYPEILNNLSDMQYSPAYAVRKHHLNAAEMLIVQLETLNIELMEVLEGFVNLDFGSNGWDDECELLAIQARNIINKIKG